MEQTLSQGFAKGQWQARTPGKIPVKVTYIVREKHRHKGGVARKPYKVNRIHWVLPEEAFSRHYEIDFEEVDRNHVELPDPKNLSRLHSHYGAEELHPVAYEHRDPEIQSEHRDEMLLYDRNYHHFLQQQEDWERKLRGKQRSMVKEKEKLESKRKLSREGKKRLTELGEAIARSRAKLDEAKEKESEVWLDKYNVVVDPDRPLKFKGEIIRAFAYSMVNSKHKIYQFSDATGLHYLWSKNLGLRKFDRSDQAYNKLVEIFTTEKLRDRILYKSLALEKLAILLKAQSLIDQAQSIVPLHQISTPQIGQFKMFSEFQSGRDKVTLEGGDDQYKVSTNGVPSIVTESFREALARYYSSVSKIVDAQSEDKDVGLEVFGEHVLQTSRNARRLMLEMDKSVELDLIENMSYDELTIPFNEDLILKYEPQSNVFGIVPAQEEQGVGASETGSKPSRGDLTERDYKNEHLKAKTSPIEEDESEGPGIAETGPAIITNSMETNQYQQVEARQEEGKEVRDIEKPVKVESTYSSKLRVPENKVIE
jgi:hypothetical protein